MTDENRTDDERDLAASLVSAPEPDAIHSDGAEFDASTESGTDSTVVEPEEAPQYGVGPFTIREVAILGLWAVGFIVSFFSVVQIPFRSVWMSGIDWVLPIGVPTVAVFLIVLRRFSPDGIRRVGSLGIDQFASVAFSVSSVIWLSYIWNTIATVIDDGPWYTTWVVWVELIVFVALVLLSVFAPFIAPFDEDFRGRPAAPAHRNARAVRAVVARPRPEPGPQSYAPVSGDGAAQATGGYPIGSYALDDAEPSTGDTGIVEPGAWSPTPAYARGTADTGAQPIADTAAVSRPFWALAPVERDVVDERTGAPVFRIGPTAWALVIADRGSSFVVQHEDGRVGVLYDVSGVTRG
jgi:hypothetical protein